MAGAHIQIDLDSQKVLQTIQKAAAVLDGEGRALMLEDMGEYLLRSTRERAALEHGPDGEQWPALEPRYAAYKRKKRPGAKMLVFDFHMLGDRLSWQIGGDTLYVGTSAKYGAAQFRTRPWLGASDADAEELSEIALDHMRTAFDD